MGTCYARIKSLEVQNNGIDFLQGFIDTDLDYNVTLPLFAENRSINAEFLRGAEGQLTLPEQLGGSEVNYAPQPTSTGLDYRRETYTTTTFKSALEPHEFFWKASASNWIDQTYRIALTQGTFTSLGISSLTSPIRRTTDVTANLLAIGNSSTTIHGSILTYHKSGETWALETPTLKSVMPAVSVEDNFGKVIALHENILATTDYDAVSLYRRTTDHWTYLANVKCTLKDLTDADTTIIQQIILTDSIIAMTAEILD